MDQDPPGPGGQACRARLMELPEELLRRILEMVEAAYVESGETSAEFLDLMTVCKRFQWGVDFVITNLSRGITRKFCRGRRVLVVKADLQRELARWSSLHRVELHVRGSNRALSPLISALGQSCPGLTTLRIVKANLNCRMWRRSCNAVARLTTLTSLTSLSFTGCRGLQATLPPLSSLRTLEADFKGLSCTSPLPALEELIFGNRYADVSNLENFRWSLHAPHLHTSSPRLRRLSLGCVFMEELLLPKSLQVLDLVNILLDVPLDLSTELPDLAELLLVHRQKDHAAPVDPLGLASLLSRGSLCRLLLQGLSRACVSQLQQLPLHTGLTSLSLHSPELDAAHVHEAVASLTALTDLDLGEVPGLVTLDISQLQLQGLKLLSISDLSSITGLGLQTRLTSLDFTHLPLLTNFPEFCNFRGLKNLIPGSCSFLPRLKVLRLVECGDVSPGSSSQQLSAPAAFVLDLTTLSSLTELVLLGLWIDKIDVSPLPFLEKLEIQDCRNFSHLSGIHSLPRLHSLMLKGSMRELHSLTVANRPRLTTLSCLLDGLQHLDLEDLPLLSGLDSLPRKLCTLRVSSCPVLETLPLKDLRPSQVGLRMDFQRTLESLELSRLPQLHLPRLGFTWESSLLSVRLVDLANLSNLMLYHCPRLEAVQVSGCPITELELYDLPKLTAPNLQINDLCLHAPDSPTLPATTSAPPPPSYLEAPAAHLPSPASPQTLQGLRSLILEQLPGLLTLDQVMLQTGLTSLRLEKLLVSRLPGEWGVLSALSQLVLKDLEVACWDPLPLDSFPALRRLSLGGGSNLVHWSGPADLREDASPLPQFWAAAAAFRSITKLDLSETKVATVDVSHLVSIQELAVRHCASLSCLAGITNLSELTSLHLSSLPELHGLAIISCSKFKSLSCCSISPRHFHLEDLPSLDMKHFSCHKNRWLGFCSRVRRPVNPLASLQSLKLRRLPSLSTLDLSDLEALEYVEVVACASLHKVSLEKLASLTSLCFQEPLGGSLSAAGSLTTRPTDCSGCIQDLSIIDMAKLQTFQCPPTLRNLSICSCWALTSLPLDNVVHLESLKLVDVVEEVFPPWFTHFRGLQHVEFDRSPAILRDRGE